MALLVPDGTLGSISDATMTEPPVISLVDFILDPHSADQHFEAVIIRQSVVMGGR